MFTAMGRKLSSAIIFLMLSAMSILSFFPVQAFAASISINSESLSGNSVVVSFTPAAQSGTYTATLYDATGATKLGSAAGSYTSIAANSDSLTITPTSALSSSSQYMVEVADSSGDNSGQISFSPQSNGSTSGNSQYGDVGALNVQVNSNGSLAISGSNGFGQSQGGAWNTILQKYRNIIVGISGIGTISMIAFFIMMFMKLGASAGNPVARSQALVGILWSGVAAAGLGSVMLIVGVFYHAIN
jgi:hypothetical protein